MRVAGLLAGTLFVSHLVSIPIVVGERQKPFSGAHPLTGGKDELEQWIRQQDAYSRAHILSNIAPFANDPSAMPGAVCASPSRSHPDYYYAWTRDSALVMNELLSWMEHNSSMSGLQRTLEDYVSFTRHLQGLKGLRYGLAEAKFHMDGRPFTKSWCNGQTDGPAIRGYTLTRYARYLMRQGRDIEHLYGLIRTDLDYVSSVWMQNWHCDIWEETRGLHFYTLMAQRRALTEGARLARMLEDYEAATGYEREIELMERRLGDFWDERGGHVMTTIEWSGGLGSKHSQLDAQVLLASLHSAMDDGVYTVESREMLATALRLLRAFEPLYSVNQVLSAEINQAVVPVGVALGRYPEDVYNGVGTSRGNPWSLVTSALAEFHYRLALEYAKRGEVRASEELRDLIQWTRRRYHEKVEFKGLLRYLLGVGDLYMARVYLHTARDHTMYEQWDRLNGYGRGAVHLTWSYAAHTAASRARSRLVELIAREA
ncbi:hypothetical protein IW150_004630 [Coemansia sp. RSA 2607]|nr:hypothetical protein IW150_004630 [Coemansia sp. RSA 2607]